MNGRKGLVLDANILVRAVFGQRVRQILEAYEYVPNYRRLYFLNDTRSSVSR